MTVEAATAEDFENVLQLALAFYAEDGFGTSTVELRDHLRVLMNSDRARTAVVRSGGQVMAFAITTTSFGLESGLIAELEDLYVVPEARRQGIAEQLIEDSAQWCGDGGCHRLELVIAPNGRDVSQLYRYYQARGFGDDGRRILSRDL